MDQDQLNSQIEQLSEELNILIQVVEHTRKKGDSLDGLDIVNEGLMECLNINIDEIINIHLEHFMASITIDNQLDNRNLDKFSDLLYKTGLLFDIIKDQETSKRLYNRALKICMYLAKAEIEFPYERHVRIKSIREKLLK